MKGLFMLIVAVGVVCGGLLAERFGREQQPPANPVDTSLREWFLVVGMLLGLLGVFGLVYAPLKAPDVTLMSAAMLVVGAGSAVSRRYFFGRWY